MRKWYLPLVSLLILLQMPLVCYAWVPSSNFFCGVDGANIPENAVYVDLLIPISADDEMYTPYHRENGLLFNIPEDSQIVQYAVDGYRSYTFHRQDARSEMQLTPSDTGSHVYVHFFCDQADAYQEQFDLYYAFCRQYKTAKMAYLDENGGVISVSNAVKLYKDDLLDRQPQTDIDLSGNTLTLEINYGPPMYLLIVIPAVVPLLLILPYLCITITVCITLLCTRKKQRKCA